MELKGSRTEENLRKAFAGELHAWANYIFYASAAREAGLEQVADMFQEIAKNEFEHARHQLKFMGDAGDSKTNLQKAIAGEHLEATKLYPEASKVAKEEGFAEIADFFSRTAKVEEKHWKHYDTLLERMDKGELVPGKTVGHSAIDMAQVMLPNQANPAGFVHGGELMKLMDNAAGVVAARHCRSNVVTATVEDINFLCPVRVGDLVIVHAMMTFTSHSSMEVRVEVETEDLLAGKRQRALTAHFIMVALDKNGKAAEAPPLIISTEEEEKLHAQALARYQARKKHSLWVEKGS